MSIQAAFLEAHPQVVQIGWTKTNRAMKKKASSPPPWGTVQAQEDRRLETHSVREAYSETNALKGALWGLRAWLTESFPPWEAPLKPARRLEVPRQAHQERILRQPKQRKGTQNRQPHCPLRNHWRSVDLHLHCHQSIPTLHQHLQHTLHPRKKSWKRFSGKGQVRMCSPPPWGAVQHLLRHLHHRFHRHHPSHRQLH